MAGCAATAGVTRRTASARRARSAARRTAPARASVGRSGAAVLRGRSAGGAGVTRVPRRRRIGGRPGLRVGGRPGPGAAAVGAQRRDRGGAGDRHVARARAAIVGQEGDVRNRSAAKQAERGGSDEGESHPRGDCSGRAVCAGLRARPGRCRTPRYPAGACALPAREGDAIASGKDGRGVPAGEQRLLRRAETTPPSRRRPRSSSDSAARAARGPELRLSRARSAARGRPSLRRAPARTSCSRDGATRCSRVRVR